MTDQSTRIHSTWRIPQRLYGRVTKGRLRSADCQIEAANWDRAMWSCPECHRLWAPGEFPDYKEALGE